MKSTSFSTLTISRLSLQFLDKKKLTDLTVINKIRMKNVIRKRRAIFVHFYDAENLEPEG